MGLKNFEIYLCASPQDQDLTVIHLNGQVFILPEEALAQFAREYHLDPRTLRQKQFEGGDQWVGFSLDGMLRAPTETPS